MKVERPMGFAKVVLQRSIQWGVADVDLAGRFAKVIVTSDDSKLDTPSEFAKVEMPREFATVDMPRGFCICLFWEVNAC